MKPGPPQPLPAAQRRAERSLGMGFCSVEDALADMRAGKMLIVVDSEDRENEGDLVMAAQCVTPEAINFMETHARGWVCVPMTAERLEALGLPLMVGRGTERQG